MRNYVIFSITIYIFTCHIFAVFKSFFVINNLMIKLFDNK